MSTKFYKLEEISRDMTELQKLSDNYAIKFAQLVPKGISEDALYED